MWKRETNVSLLRQVQEEILKEADRFDMSAYFKAAPGEEILPIEEARCRTAMCIAGWAIALGAPEGTVIHTSPCNVVTPKSTSPYGTFAGVYASWLLGLNDAETLFQTSQWPEPYRTEHYRAWHQRDRRAMARAAARRIDHLIDTGE